MKRLGFRGDRPVRSGSPPCRVGLRLACALALASVAMGAGACRPDVGAPPSLIETSRLLTVMAHPAEANPGDPVEMVALAVDPGGTLTTPIAWTVCKTPKPPAEANSVSRFCVVEQPDDPSVDSGPVEVKIPSNACSLFGPIAPPTKSGDPPIRARDPDVTGGYYLPVRAAARALRDPFGAPVAFGFVRISCGLAGAGAETSAAYNQAHVPNVAPVIEPVATLDAVGNPVAEARPGTRVTLRVRWDATSAESFLVYDRVHQVLVEDRESIGVSWFVTGGEMLHDRTGRDGGDLETTSDNVWTAPTVATATPFHFWVVVRDNRGAASTQSFDLTVTP